MKVVAFLPVKGTSTRVGNKNIKLLDGKPLFMHTLEKLISCDFIDEVYLDTESQEIIDTVSYLDCKILKRDPELANNKTDGNKLFINEVNQVDADIYMQVLCTSPFIKVETLKKSVDVLLESKEYDSVTMVKNEKQYTWSEEGATYDVANIPNSVDLPDTIIETMGLYTIRREAALKTQRRIGEKTFLLNVTAQEAVDVNWPDDFELANLIQAGKREKQRKLFNNMKTHLSSPVLSDILDELGLDSIVNHLTPNLPNAKIFGYAKTLKIRAIQDGESPDQIYDALNSYDTIIPGDVIIVENEISDFAYFGELNANLAIRSGAAGAIIGGVTRDSSQVQALNFPVFSKGYVCRDVKNRAVVDSMNQKINFYGVDVSPGDLIFADHEGIIMIPREHIAKVFEKVYEILSTENSILIDIAKGKSAFDLVTSHGTF